MGWENLCLEHISSWCWCCRYLDHTQNLCLISSRSDHISVWSSPFYVKGVRKLEDRIWLSSNKSTDDPPIHFTSFHLVFRHFLRDSITCFLRSKHICTVPFPWDSRFPLCFFKINLLIIYSWVVPTQTLPSYSFLKCPFPVFLFWDRDIVVILFLSPCLLELLHFPLWIFSLSQDINYPDAWIWTI